MRFSTYTYVFIILLVFSGVCNAQGRVNNPEYGPYQDQSDNVLRFQLMAQYGAEETPFDAIIPDRRAIRSVVNDNEGNIYLLDRMTFQIKSFAPDGSFRWAAGQEGKGPGDLSDPGYMFMGPENKLFVINNGTASLRIFDLDGSFVTERIFPAENIYQSYYGAMIDDSRILISKSGRMKRYEAEFIILDLSQDQLSIDSRFHLGQNPDINMPIGYYFYPPHRIMDNKIAMGNIAEYRFILHDLDGNEVLLAERDKDVFYDISKVATEHMGLYAQVIGKSNPPIRVNDKILLSTAYWSVDPEELYQKIRSDQRDLGSDYMNSIDLLNNDFELLYSLESDGRYNSIGEIIHSDGKGNIFTIVSVPYPQIRKYKVILDLGD